MLIKIIYDYRNLVKCNYIATVKNGWRRAIKLYQKDDDPDNFLLDDGSLFCSKEELLKCFPEVAGKLNLYNSIPLPKNVDNEDIRSG